VRRDLARLAADGLRSGRDCEDGTRESGVTYRTILVERRKAAAIVSLNRPEKRNSIGGPMMVELHEALSEIAADPTIRVLLLRGAGADFCPGADIKHYGGADAAPAAPGWAGTREFNVAVMLHEMPAVTVAAISGACAGAGFGWACACDLRIASETAKFNTAFLDVGVAGDMGGPWSLPRIVGAGKARELYFLPGKFDASEAFRIGLVSRVAPAADFEGEVEAILGRLSAAAPLALSAMKANFLAAEKVGFSDYIALESEKHLRLFQTQDTTEAFKAFVEKRAPVFQGR
jgi:2-(1,2-epoxy-1,2-dihydrophenyl)acetyl-CoA isomerase